MKFQRKLISIIKKYLGRTRTINDAIAKLTEARLNSVFGLLVKMQI